MSLAFGSPVEFTFRMVSSPQVAGLDTPIQKTEMFGALGATFLRGEAMTGKHTYDVLQDGFADRQAAKAFSLAVQKKCGTVSTLAITNEADITACLMHASETRINAGKGTTTGHYVRMSLTFEEVAS